jgi:hypothetical protein
MGVDDVADVRFFCVLVFLSVCLSRLYDGEPASAIRTRLATFVVDCINSMQAVLNLK